MVVKDRPGEAGEETPPGVWPMAQGVRTQSSKWSRWLLARVRVRACVHYSTAQGDRYPGTFVGSSVAGFLDPMTSPGTPLWFADVVYRCLSVIESGALLLASSCSNNPLYADRHGAKIRQSGSIFSPDVARRGGVFSGWPPLINDARALMHVSAPAGAMQRQGWGFPARPRPGPAVPLSNGGRPTLGTSHPSRPGNTQN